MYSANDASPATTNAGLMPMMRTVPLLPIECKNLAWFWGITTATFFEGDLKTVEDSLRSRVREILVANPWLTGFLVSDGRKAGPKGRRFKQVELKYPTAISEEHLTSVFRVRSDLEFPSENATDPQILTDVLLGIEPYCYIQSGSMILNTDTPVAMFSAFEMARGFVLVFSLSHVVADGHTYYTILDMLHDKNEVFSMNVDRSERYEEAMGEMFGEKVTKWNESKKFLANLVLSSLNPFAKKSYFNHHVDKSKVKSRKAAVKKTDKVKFVSTNDILTSHVATTAGCDLFQMVMNMRGRIPEFDRNDAGNYQGNMWFNAAAYTEPGIIREKLIDMQPSAAGEWLPGAWKTMRASVGMVTNWTSSFGGDLTFDRRVKHLLHIPVFNFNVYPNMPLTMFIIYTPRPGETAIMHFLLNTKGTRQDFLSEEGGVMGGPVEIPFAHCAAAEPTQDQ